MMMSITCSGLSNTAKMLSLASVYLLSMTSHSESVVAQTSRSARFECQSVNGKYTTVAITSSGKDMPLFVWNSGAFAQSGYPDDRRCTMVSQRLQELSDASQLRFLTSGLRNSERIICNADRKGGECLTQVYTLKKGDDPLAKIAQLIKLRKGFANTSALYETGGRVYLDVEALFSFIDADVDADEKTYLW